MTDGRIIAISKWVVEQVRVSQPTTTRALWNDAVGVFGYGSFSAGLDHAIVAGLVTGWDEAWVIDTPPVVDWMRREGDWTPTMGLPSGCRSLKQLHALADLGIIERRGGGRGARLEWAAA